MTFKFRVGPVGHAEVQVEPNGSWFRPSSTDLASWKQEDRQTYGRLVETTLQATEDIYKDC